MIPPRKIFFLTPSIRLYGARRSLLDLATHLEPGWGAHVVCSGPGGLAQELQKFQIPISVIPHYAWRKGRYLLHRYVQAWRVAQVLRREQPALIHINEFHATSVAAVARRLAFGRPPGPGPLRADSGISPAPGGGAPGPERLDGGMPGPPRPAEGPNGHYPPLVVHIRLDLTARQIHTYGLERAARIIAVSEAMARLFDPFPALRERVRVVYNGVDVRGFAPPSPEERHAARAALGLGPTDFVVGLVGLLSERKQQHVAIEALRLLRLRASGATGSGGTGRRIRLLFAGEAFGSEIPYGERLRHLVAEAGLQDDVQFLGFRQPIQPVYAAMDANLLISNEEGFGRTIVEAGAMGIPSIGAETGGIPELILPGKTGWTIRCGAAEQLAEVVHASLEAPDHARALGLAAREHVMARFTVEAYVRGVTRVWEEALAEAGRR